MLNIILGMLKNGGENISSMRVAFLLSIVIAGAIALIGVFKGVPINDLSLLCGLFLGSGFGGKTIQKHIETQKEVNK